MEAYRYTFVDPEQEALARVISDLFPEQTSFDERVSDDGMPEIRVQWVALRFGPAARRMVLIVRFAAAAFARYRASPPQSRARGAAILRAYVEAALGSLEERYANGEEVPRELTIELGDEFA